MKPEDYPSQEPLSAQGQAYHAAIMGRFPALSGTEISYGPDPYQSVLIYPDAGANGDVLLFFHGGGWTSGYKEWMAFMAPALARAGVTFMTAGYRLAPRHLFPVGFDDCCRAVAACREYITGQRGVPSRLFVGGHSAGGHYAALAAVRRDWQAGLGLPDNVIRGCLPLSGVFLFGDGSGLPARPRFLGPADASNASGIALQASPLHALKEAPPPFLIATGSADFPHLMVQADSMAAALRDAGGDVERLTLQGLDHFSASLAAGDSDGPWLPHAVNWMSRR